MRAGWVSAHKGRFHEDAAQLHITFQKASELKNNSHLFFLMIRFFGVSSAHCFVHLGCSFLPGLISFGDLAGSLQGERSFS